MGCGVGRESREAGEVDEGPNVVPVSITFETSANIQLLKKGLSFCAREVVVFRAPCPLGIMLFYNITDQP